MYFNSKDASKISRKETQCLLISTFPIGTKIMLLFSCKAGNSKPYYWFFSVVKNEHMKRTSLSSEFTAS